MKICGGGLLLALLVGCSGGGGGAGDVWTETSAQLSVRNGDFFGGYSGFERTRAQLSPAQLAALQQLRSAPDLDQCLEDGLNVQLTVTDQSGGTKTYVNDSCRPGSERIDPAAAERFLGVLPKCVASKDARLASLDTAPTIAVGDGCLNGLFTSSAGASAPLFVRVDVTSPDSGHPLALELSDCGDRAFDLELLDPTGSTLLASGSPSATSCSSLRHVVSEAGRYVVRVTPKGGSGAGDFWLRAK